MWCGVAQLLEGGSRDGIGGSTVSIVVMGLASVLVLLAFAVVVLLAFAVA